MVAFAEAKAITNTTTMNCNEMIQFKNVTIYFENAIFFFLENSIIYTFILDFFTFGFIVFLLYFALSELTDL